MAKSLTRDDLLKEVKHMRELQKSFWQFKTHHPHDDSMKKKILIAAREQEATVDKLIKAIETENQLSIFPDDITL